MRFYLGVHRPSWLTIAQEPLCVSVRRLRNRDTNQLIRRPFQPATCRWGLDSGAFTEIGKYGRWTIPTSQYVDEVARISQEIGGLDWAGPQDWMCEPPMLAKTGLIVREHQERTVANYLGLRPSGLPFNQALRAEFLTLYVRDQGHGRLFEK